MLPKWVPQREGLGGEDFWGHPAPWGRQGTEIHISFHGASSTTGFEPSVFTAVRTTLSWHSSSLVDLKAASAQKPPVYRGSVLCFARTNLWQQFEESLSECAWSAVYVHVNVEVACIPTCFCLCLDSFQAEHFLPICRRVVGYDSAAVRNIPRIHSEKKFTFTLCWRGWPMTSFTLTHFLSDPFAVSVARCSLFCYPPIG